MEHIIRKSTSKLICLPSLKMFGLIWLEWQAFLNLKNYYENIKIVDGCPPQKMYFLVIDDIFTI